MKTYILDIKRNSLDDGAGIRTVIFFKGCPLSCVWCQNPESKLIEQEISFHSEDCNKCEKCIKACDLKVLTFYGKYPIEREFCDLCGECVLKCDQGALTFVGKAYEIRDLIDIILKDKTFYTNSGGGVTFSGGEPTLHMDYLHKLLLELKKENINTCLETCGMFNLKKFEELLLPYLDVIYFDLKLFDKEDHILYCNAPNEIIRENFEYLIKLNNINLLPRIPLIPKVTATEHNLTAFATYLKALGIKKIGLLPYNPLWLSKVDAIGVKPEYTRDKWLTKKEKDQIKEIFEDFEFRDF